MAEGYPTYKTIMLYFTEDKLDTWFKAQLRAMPSKTLWEFTVFQNGKPVWDGDLRTLLELILLGAVYKDRLAKEKPCETQPASTPKTSDTEQA